MNPQSKMLRLLETEKFCFLSTSFQDNPHVCLMIFTYLANEGIIILSSRTDTIKVNHIEKNSAVALLLYNLGSNGEGPVSCTIFGTATVVPPDRAGLYRRAHHKKHPDMGAFITGENISVIAVELKGAALSDIMDSVNTWSQEK